VHPTKYPLTFGFQSIFILQIDCVLSLQELYGIVAALRFPSRLSLFTIATSSCKPLANARHSYRKSVEVGWYLRPLICCRSIYNYFWFSSHKNV
jgi:hypothetical protein